MNINKIIAKARAENVIRAVSNAEEFFKPFTEEWVALRIKHNDIGYDAKFYAYHFIGFGYIDTPDDSLEFEAPNARHSGSIIIPLDFFDNPQPYRDAAEQALADRKALINSRNKKGTPVYDLP